MHPDLSFFRVDHHGLIPHPAHHVKRLTGFPPQGRFQYILRYPPFDDLAQRYLDLVKPVRRTEATDSLMRAPVIVVFDPERQPVPGIIKTVELNPA